MVATMEQLRPSSHSICVEETSLRTQSTNVKKNLTPCVAQTDESALAPDDAVAHDHCRPDQNTSGSKQFKIAKIGLFNKNES